MGLIFEVNTYTDSHITFSHDTLSNTMKVQLHDDEAITPEKVTLGLDYNLIEGDYIYTVLKCKQMLEKKVKLCATQENANMKDILVNA